MFFRSFRPGFTLCCQPTSMSVWWLKLRGCHYPQVDGLGVARELKELQGTIACLGTKLTASKYSCPSHGQPRPCPLQSGHLDWTDTCSSYSVGNWLGPGAGTGRGERGAGRSDKVTVESCSETRRVDWKRTGAVGCVWGALPVWGNRRKGLELF